MNSKIERIVISPPFGTFIHLHDATSVKGTFTYERRSGKLARILKTIRRTRRGWVNNMGLRNPGLRNLKPAYFHNKKHLYSVAAIEESDWMKMLEYFKNIGVTDIMVEMNISCPNALVFPPPKEILREYANNFSLVSVKFPPHTYTTNALIVRQAYEVGIRHFHFSNTYPNLDGGLSGTFIKRMAQNNIESRVVKFPDATYIGGGGIYAPQDVRDYKESGANCFSLATIWFTPWKVPGVLREIRNTE